MKRMLGVGGSLLAVTVLAGCTGGSNNERTWLREQESVEMHSQETVRLYSYERTVTPPKEAPPPDEKTPPEPRDRPRSPEDERFHEEMDQVDEPITPPPAPVPQAKKVGEEICQPFVLPRPARIPELPVLTEAQRRDPDLAAPVLVRSLQQMRTYIRTYVAQTERAYINYRASCRPAT